MTESAAARDAVTVQARDAVRIDDLRLSLPVSSGGKMTPDIGGFRLTVTNDGLAVVLAFASGLLTTVSRGRIETLLAAMDEHPRLHPVRWYYASLFRVAGLRDELAISGGLIEGGLEIRARFAQAESGGLLRQLRDRARNLATVTVRLGFTADGGSLRVRLDLSPDVNATLAKLVLNEVVDRPGITRVDDTSVRIDLAAVIRARPDVPAVLSGAVQEIDVSPERMVIVVA